jgi:thiol-disulfide isomerase/thioredoxin
MDVPKPAATSWAPGNTPSPPPRPEVPIPPLLGPARVPSCVLTGDTLYNFALRDVNGQPWEFRQRRGRVVLLDFWGTWCVPCLQAVPHLNILQSSYGPYGLEVVGIEYEREPVPLPEQAQRVHRVRQRLGINYRLLLASDSPYPCPVKSQFGVSQFPTLVLLSERGQIIWRSAGLGPQELRELEVIIRQQLGIR